MSSFPGPIQPSNRPSKVKATSVRILLVNSPQLALDIPVLQRATLFKLGWGEVPQ